MKFDSSSYELTRGFFQKGLGFIYFIAFTATLLQFRALIGENGLTPVPLFLKQVRFWDYPSIFWFNSSDAFIGLISWLGFGLSLAALTGVSERFGVAVSATVWSLLWLFYLSIINVGQTFYSFGWETMLLETGFLAIFMGSRDTRAPAALFWFLRWILFRLMFGAGLIKLRGDACWRDLTCMLYHYETQPIPNPLSWYFHHLPEGFLKFQTLYTHFIEIIVPWFYFVTGPLGWIAGILSIIFQGCLILSGNLSWLNYLTIVIAISCLDDGFWNKLFRMRIPEAAALKTARRVALIILSTVILCLSIRPALNLISPRQRMNSSFDPLHLVNTYGAFGSITKVRNEIILEGTNDEPLTTGTLWQEYEFKAKPGGVSRRPPLIAPYHLRLDWLMWFAAMGDWRHYPWTVNLINKLLQNDPEILKQIAKNPFPAQPPRYIRAVLYKYQFTTPAEKKETGNWWTRTPVRLYLPPISLDNEEFQKILRTMGWN